MFVFSLKRSAHFLFCASKFQYHASVNWVPANWSTPSEWMSVMNIRPTASWTLPLSELWLNCLTKLMRSPPACIEPMTSGLPSPALVMKVAKLSLGNGEAIDWPTVPPAAVISLVKDLFMSWPKA